MGSESIGGELVAAVKNQTRTSCGCESQSLDCPKTAFSLFEYNMFFTKQNKADYSF